MISINPAKPLLVVTRPTRPNYTVLPVFSVIDSGTVDGAVVVGDANLLRNIAASTRTEAIVQPDIESDPDFESLNPSVATVDQAGRLTRVADGTASIVAANGFDRQRFEIPVLQAGGQVIDTFVSWLDNSAAKHCADNIDGLIAGKSPTDATLQIYSAFDHVAATYTRSATLWCAAHHAALTACNAWQSNYGSGQSRAQTAITPRHIVGAAHYSNPITIGGTQRFVAADGTVVNRTVTHTRKIESADIQLSLLDSDLPASIIPASILPSDWATYLRRIADPANILLGIPCILRNQFAEARVFDLARLNTLNASFRIPSDAARSFWYRELIPGDSGGPAMLLIAGKLILVTTWTGSFSGPSYHAVNWSTEITTLDALASINTGYAPSVVDLSTFTNFAA